LLRIRTNLFVTSTATLFYNRIAVLRAERGLSRQAVAEAIDVNYQTIGYIERGDYFPSLDLAFRLAELFAVPIEMIFSRRPFEPMSAVQASSDRKSSGGE
jgi:putative transcriptional regulator